MIPEEYVRTRRPRRLSLMESLRRLPVRRVLPAGAMLVACIGLFGCAGSDTRPPSPRAAGPGTGISQLRLIPGPRDSTVRAPWAKLLVTDGRGRYLLVRWKSQWEVPGTELSTAAGVDEDSCARFLDGFANELGVKVRTPRLAADVLQHFARGKRPVPFRWYEARLVDGTGKIPVGEPDIDQVAWMPLREALAAMPYPAARRTLEMIAQWPHHTIRGEYEVDYSVSPPGGSLRIIHDFSPEASPAGP